MSIETYDVSKGKRPGTYRLPSGDELPLPDSWGLLPPGDATLTRRVKAATSSWTVKEKRGRRTFSQGLWADARVIELLKEKLEAERATPAYQKKLAASRRRSAEKQRRYVEEFRASVSAYLDFHPRYAEFEIALAEAVTTHATPVGSGTVARTQRIDVDARAEAAVIAWMRHQTTAYDNLVIPRVKGARRQTRRMLAAKSKALLQRYRKGGAPEPERCPLARALGAAD